MLFEQVQRVILAKKYFGVRCTLFFVIYEIAMNFHQSCFMAICYCL